jgi:hypothetical protein
MPSIIKVDQIQSDLGTVNLSSNLQFSSGFTMRSPTIATPTFTGQATIPTINLTGGQIAFPASQNASSDPNTLDDYEEGSWTPFYTSTGASFSYTTQYGQYIKIGKFVKAQFYLYATATGTTSNSAIIGGLPFASENLSPFSQDAAPCWSSGIVLQLLVNNNASTITPWKNGAVAVASASDVNGIYVVGTAVYRAAS